MRWPRASLILASYGASAQTTDQLVKGATDTSNVLNYGMGYNLQRFSPLTQINKDTAKNLVPVWNYSFADDRSEESQPLVYQGVIYVTTHNATMAVDAKTGKQIWKTKVEYPAETPRIVCCGIINRGAALYRRQGVPHHARRQCDRARRQDRQGALAPEGGRHQGRLFDDGGAAGRRRRRASPASPAPSSAPAASSTAGIPRPASICGAPTRFPRPDEPGGDTWKGDTWKLGGGSTWITGSYDPELNTVYWGIGNPGPFNSAVRPGDNLYTCSVLALDPKTGKIKWHYQFSPNNPFDYDSVAEMVLADINVEGKPTKVLMDANRNGFFYVLDRTNGKLLAANPYVKVNWATGIDMKTGRPIETDVSKDAREGKKVVVYPSILGGKNWEPMSFNPQTGLAYANTLAFGGHYKTEPATYKAGEWYLGMDLTDLWEWGDGPRGHLKAIDPMTGKTKWEAPSDIPRFSGVLSTAGGVVFSGPVDRRVRGVRRRQRQEAVAVPDRLGHRGTAGDLAAGRRAVCRRRQRLWRRLLAVLRRRAAGQRAARRIAVGLCGQELIADRT